MRWQSCPVPGLTVWKRLRASLPLTKQCLSSATAFLVFAGRKSLKKVVSRMTWPSWPHTSVTTAIQWGNNSSLSQWQSRRLSLKFNPKNLRWYLPRMSKPRQAWCCLMTISNNLAMRYIASVVYWSSTVSRQAACGLIWKRWALTYSSLRHKKAGQARHVRG